MCGMKCHNTQFNAMNRISFQIITIKRVKMDSKARHSDSEFLSESALC